MTTWRARLAVLGVFLAGCICGAFIVNLYRLSVENRIAHSRDLIIEVAVYKMGQDLDLDEAQQESVRTILRGARSEVFELTKDLQPRFQEIFERTQGRIRDTLTAEQREKFDKVVAERRELIHEIERSMKDR